MSAIATESDLHPVADQATQSLERGKRQLVNTFKYVPEDKLHWAPSETAKSAIRIAAHCAITNFGIAALLRGESMPITSFAELFAISAAKEKEFTSKEQTVQAIEASAAAVIQAIRELAPEKFGENVGSGELEGPAAFYMNLAGIHMSMHSAQIDYLQTVWGDGLPHFGG